MPLNPRHAIVAAIAVLALGAGAAPALAATQSSDPQLSAAFARYGSQIGERIDLSDANGFRAAIPVLSANVERSLDASSAVARLPLPAENHYSVYQKADAYWTTGARLQAAADAELVRGIEESGRPDYPALDEQDRTATANLAVAHDYLNYATRLLTDDPGAPPAALDGDAPVAAVAPLSGAGVSNLTSPLARAIQAAHESVNTAIAFNPRTFSLQTFRGSTPILLGQEWKNCIREAGIVGRVGTTGPSQIEARAYWTTGALLKAAGDGEVIEGINAPHPDDARLDEQLRQGLVNIELADTYFAYARDLLAGQTGMPPVALR